MIIEGLLTTSDQNGPHIAALGPVVDEQLETWLLRPFQTSTTFRLLRDNPQCIFHVTDDVLTVVQCALGLTADVTCRAHPAGGWIVDGACHWYKLEVTDWDVSNLRSEARARVVDRGIERPFWGWNRAKHAVLEGAILASRLHLLESDTIQQELKRLQVAVDKTAGDREWQAWELINEYVAQRTASQ